MRASFRMRFRVTSRMPRKPTFVILRTLLPLVMSLSVACAPRHEAEIQCPTIEMSPVADTPTDSTKSVTLNDTGTILISRTPIVTTGDITGATAAQAGGGWVLDVRVTDAAATRVREFSAQHVGTKLALAVDGKVQGTPRIAGPITGNKYQIDDLTRADAQRVATALSNGCPR